MTYIIATKADSDGTGYCKDCGTTIGEAHHLDCDITAPKRTGLADPSWVARDGWPKTNAQQADSPRRVGG